MFAAIHLFFFLILEPGKCHGDYEKNDGNNKEHKTGNFKSTNKVIKKHTKLKIVC